MSFVPLGGPATFVKADPPRAGEVEFTAKDSPRVVRMPMRGAVPVLTRALRADDLDDSVGLLAGATLLAMRLVAAGKVQLGPAGDSWRAGPLTDQDRDQAEQLARGNAEAHTIVLDVLDAVADTLTRTPTKAPVHSKWRDRVADHGLPQQVLLTLRVDAPAEELLAGQVILVPQAHNAEDTSHFAELGSLWDDPIAQGFAHAARSDGLRQLRLAAEAWPPLEELLNRPVPDKLVLAGNELSELLQDGAVALSLAGYDVLWPRGLRSELIPQARVERVNAPREGPLMTGLFGPESLFSFDWRLALRGPDGEADPLTDEEMSELARAKVPIVKLRDNWTIIDPRMLRRAKVKPKPVPVMTALQAGLTGVLNVDDEEIEVHPGASLERIRDTVRDATSLSPMETPADLHAELRDYQRRGLTWLAELTGLGLGACLADDMGLGKTITLIALHLHRRARNLAGGPTLVVCPTSLLGNWEAEIRRFAPGVDVRRFHGSTRSLAGVHDGFVLTTYGTMRLDHDSLAQVSWDLVVADEAQHIKNARSSTARNLRQIPSRGRVALTGTPVENNLTELWAILDWALPGLLGSRAAFRKRWAAPIESGVDPAIARQFAQLVEPFLLRRRKSDPDIAPELPAKTEMDELVGLTREQAVLYQALVTESMDRIERADVDARRGLVLAMLTGLKQICNHPAHYLRQPHARLGGRSEKLDLFDELVGTIIAEAGAVLVFTQYVAMADLLQRHLTAAGIDSQLLHGGTPVKAREKMVARFQAGEVPVFVLSLKAGGTGLNLTRADHVIHFDRWWNPAVEDQATDRAHRIGQHRAVQVHRLITEGTLEQRIAQLLERKRDLAESVLGAGEVALTELDNSELRSLVQLRTPHG